jgi:alpha-beta hydrolase superfamily lysophospholipase
VSEGIRGGKQLIENKDLARELKNGMGGPWGAKLCSAATSMQSNSEERSTRISNHHEFWFTRKDGLRIACKRRDSRGPARGVLQIAHKMGKHSGLLFSGSEDPVGQQLEGVRTLIDRYRKVGARNISRDSCEAGRHEMLNELNRAEVRSSLLA